MAGQARHDGVEVRFGTSETGSPNIDRVGCAGPADIQTLKDRSVRSGLVKAQPGRAGRNGQNAEERLPKGRTKRLTFTEGRLRLPTGTTRPESQAFRQAVRWADGFGLDPLASLILLCLSIVRASSALRSACAKWVL